MSALTANMEAVGVLGEVALRHSAAHPLTLIVESMSADEWERMPGRVISAGRKALFVDRHVIEYRKEGYA